MPLTLLPSKFRLTLLAVLLLLALPLTVQAVPGLCDGTPNDDNIDCTTSLTYPDNAIELDLGSDTLIIRANVSVGYVWGDIAPGEVRPSATGGNDRVENYGVTSVIAGDGVRNANGGDDVLIMHEGGTEGFMTGDDLLINQNGTYRGGNDTITNHGTSGSLSGDAITITDGASPTVTGGDDNITNTGTTGQITGDGITLIENLGHKFFGRGGADVITNSGIVEGYIIGDSAAEGGTDTIINTGTVTAGIYGDVSPETNCRVDCYPSERGAADIIINSGTVGSCSNCAAYIYAEGGDDVVTLRPGANGGDDNNLPVDGGAGNDTLIFEFGAATPATYYGSPSSGSVTIDGQTFRWANFETVEGLGTSLIGNCDGTTGNDVINCTAAPSNPDPHIDGNSGNDQITLASGITVEMLSGDSQQNWLVNASDGGNDSITSNGTTVAI
ncbi:MAG: hypothetical protein SF029_02285 [bacterium]|nr:hypothetical protein [bacterium]